MTLRRTAPRREGFPARSLRRSGHGREVGGCSGTVRAVLVLLPPSEAKAPGGTGAAVGRRPALSTPGLAAARAALIAALRRAAAADPTGTAAGLRLPPALAGAALAANRAVATAPSLPALDRYAGVLYAALGAAHLSPAARARAETEVLVFSGLWGVVRGGDPVPDYRVPAAGSVPGLGSVTAHWRAPLAATMPALVGDQAVLDLRSTDYRAMWRPDRALAERVVTVRVLAERGTGAARRTGPVSHHAKQVKGRLARHLLAGRRHHREPLAALTDAADALALRLVDTSTARGQSVDLIGPLGAPLRRTLTA